MEKLAALFKYLGERPLVLKIIDMILILTVAFGLATAYIVATNFKDLFLTAEQQEYNQFVNAVEINHQISEILKKLRIEVNASRVGIYQFHNGTTGMGNIPFFFYSQTFESIGPGISSELNRNQRISITIDPRLRQMAAESPFDYSKRIDTNDSFGHILESQGVREYYRIALFSLDDKFIGFLMIEYLAPTTLEVERIHTLLEKYSRAVIGIVHSQ